jgi:hypothetical protein
MKIKTHSGVSLDGYLASPGGAVEHVDRPVTPE